MLSSSFSAPKYHKGQTRSKSAKAQSKIGWWHMLKVLKWHKTPIVDLLLIGVLPEYRNKGANALIFDDLIRWFWLEYISGDIT